MAYKLFDRVVLHRVLKVIPLELCLVGLLNWLCLVGHLLRLLWLVGWLFVAFTLIGQSDNVGFGLVKFS